MSGLYHEAQAEFRARSRLSREISAVVLALGLAALRLTAAAEPHFARSDLFSAGDNGYAFYRIPGLVVSARGTAFAYCEARRTGRSDWENIDILLRRSTDGGRTWEAARRMADIPGPKTKNAIALAQKLAAPDEVTYTNPVAIAARDGTLHFFFCLEFNRCFYRRSDDDGVTFSPPVEITATFLRFRPEIAWQTLTTGPTHGIELRNGRLIVPVGLSTGTVRGGFKPSTVAMIYSDDHGRTWQRGDVAVPDDPEWPNPNCGVVAQLADGRVMLNVRSEARVNRRLVTTSADGATGWSRPRFDNALLEPISAASLVSFSAGVSGPKSRLLFANPDNLQAGGGKEIPGGPRDRRNLSIKLSDDDGATWPVNKTLEPGPSAYSDLAVLPDGTILCLYERGAVGGNLHKPSQLSIARFDLAWLAEPARSPP